MAWKLPSRVSRLQMGACVALACTMGLWAAANPGTDAPYTAVADATVWPNLTRLNDGTLLLVGYDKASHGKVEGDVACWASTDDGATWTYLSTLTAHEPDTVRMNHAAGLDRHGNLVALVSGWSDIQQPGAPKRNTLRDAILPAWVCRSADGGVTWTVDRAFPDDPAGRVLIPFGDLVGTDHGRLYASAYSTSYYDKPGPWAAYFLVSEDDGATWRIQSHIGDDINETALLHLGDGEWLAASRTQTTRLFRSTDGGTTWADEGAVTEARQYPAHLLALPDGRIALTYGDRREGHLGVGARVSADGGKTWGPPMALAAMPESDGGYPASVVRRDGRVLTLYYAKDGASYSVQAVVWTPPAAEDTP